MNPIDRQLREVWKSLRSQNLQRDHRLKAVRIKRLRGIANLRVEFQYPVCVLASPNGCGKSTVLFACACAYKDPSRGPRELMPGTLFPNFINRKGEGVSDSIENTELGFDYLHDRDDYNMDWKRRRSWSKSFRGRKGGKQPERQVYLRALANLTNPSEVRSLLQLARKDFHTETVDPELLIFADRILPNSYRDLSVISTPNRDLLFAEIDNQDTKYSEFHMSSGERSILRISKDISGLNNALLLIDEIEAGLHPYIQQQIMLELQRIALRQNLQIIVTSHSPVVLDSVPEEARIFLDRDITTGEVQVMPAYRDIFQKALYGQSHDRLSILCEDSIAEAIVLGALDVLCGRMDLRHDDFVISRDTGRDEFPAHLRTLHKFSRLSDFLMILDGDARDTVGPKMMQVAEQIGSGQRPLFLPTNNPPEAWIWETLNKRSSVYSEKLNLSSDEMKRRLKKAEQAVSGIPREQDALKSALSIFANQFAQSEEEITRIVARVAAEEGSKDMSLFTRELEERIDAWRQSYV